MSEVLTNLGFSGMFPVKLAVKVDKERYSTPALGGKWRGGGNHQMDDVTNIFQSYCPYECCEEFLKFFISISNK